MTPIIVRNSDPPEPDPAALQVMAAIHQEFLTIRFIQDAEAHQRHSRGPDLSHHHPNWGVPSKTDFLKYDPVDQSDALPASQRIERLLWELDYKADTDIVPLFTDPDGPLVFLMPTLASAAYLNSVPSPESAPSGLVPVTGHRRYYSSPNPEVTGWLSDDLATWRTARWQLELGGWKWNEGLRMADWNQANEPLADKLGGNKQKELRSRAIMTLYREWHSGQGPRVPTRLVDEVRRVLAWFFPLDRLTRKKVEAVMHDAHKR